MVLFINILSCNNYNTTTNRNDLCKFSSHEHDVHVELLKGKQISSVTLDRFHWMKTVISFNNDKNDLMMLDEELDSRSLLGSNGRFLYLHLSRGFRSQSG